VVVPHDPNALDLTARLGARRATLVWYRRGGRDLFSRVLAGSQQSITAGLAVVVIAGGIARAGLFPACWAGAATPSSCG
jgi:peptide/nickel transport system permease protein